MKSLPRLFMVGAALLFLTHCAMAQTPLTASDQALLQQSLLSSVANQKKLQQAYFQLQSVRAQSLSEAAATSATKGVLMQAIQNNVAALGVGIKMAGVFSGLASFSLKTTIGFPGFKDLASQAGLVSEFATAGTGILGIVAASKDNTKTANFSTAVAALISGLGSVTNRQGQSSSLQGAFGVLNEAASDVAVLQYMQQDYNIVGPDRDALAKAIDDFEADLTANVPADPTKTTDAAAEEIAQRYVTFMKLMDAWYDTDATGLRNALATQVNAANCGANPGNATIPGTPPYSAPTIQGFCQLISGVDQAEDFWKAHRAIFDNLVAQAESYVVATQ